MPWCSTVACRRSTTRCHCSNRSSRLARASCDPAVRSTLSLVPHETAITTTSTISVTRDLVSRAHWRRDTIAHHADADTAPLLRLHNQSWRLGTARVVSRLSPSPHGAARAKPVTVVWPSATAPARAAAAAPRSHTASAQPVPPSTIDGEAHATNVGMVPIGSRLARTFCDSIACAGTARPPSPPSCLDVTTRDASSSLRWWTTSPPTGETPSCSGTSRGTGSRSVRHATTARPAQGCERARRRGRGDQISGAYASGDRLAAL